MAEAIPEGLGDIRERIVDEVYRLALPFGLVPAAGAMVRNHFAHVHWTSQLPLLLYLLPVGALLWRRKLSAEFRAILVVVVFFVSGVLGLFVLGIGAPGAAYLPASVVVAWLLLGRAAGIAVGVTAAGFLAVAGVFNVALGGNSAQLSAWNRSITFWVQIGAVELAVGALVIVTCASLLRLVREREETLRALNADLEARVRERTERLEESRKDLMAFSYAVSHDLRAPLRAVKGYAEVLEEECASIPPQARMALDRIAAGTDRMKRIIEALLELSVLDRHVPRTERVDMDAIVADLREELDASEVDGAPVAWNVDPLPPCRTDPDLIRQVWANLLLNAAKFSRFSSDPAIVVASESREDGIWYVVRDNGPGFEPSFAQELFGLFRRGHGPEVEGLGIGLATAKRILVRLGGAIEAEGRPGSGALFRFRVGEPGTAD